MAIDIFRSTLLSNQTAVGAGASVLVGRTAIRSAQITLRGTLPSATVVVEGSHDPDLLGWAPMGTATLSSDGDSAIVSVMQTMSHVRARVSAISGVGAKVAAVLVVG